MIGTIASYYEPQILTRTSQSPVTYEVKEGGCWECLSHAKNPSSGAPFMHRAGRCVRVATHLFRMEHPGERGPCVRHTCGNKWCINPEHYEWRAVGRWRKFTREQADQIRQLKASGGYTHRALAVQFDTNMKTISDIINRKGAYAP